MEKGRGWGWAGGVDLDLLVEFSNHVVHFRLGHGGVLLSCTVGVSLEDKGHVLPAASRQLEFSCLVSYKSTNLVTLCGRRSSYSCC